MGFGSTGTRGGVGLELPLCVSLVGMERLPALGFCRKGFLQEKKIPFDQK